MPKITITIDKDQDAYASEYAKRREMTKADAYTKLFGIGITRDQALSKYNSKQPKKESTKKAAKKSAKKAPAKKVPAAKKAGKKASATKSATSSSGGKYTDADLLAMKESGKSNPQIAKETGLSKDQVFRRIKAAQKAAQKAA